MASDSGGIYAGVAVIIGAACTGFATVYGAVRTKRRKDDEKIRQEAVELAARIIARGLLERGGWDGDERRGGDADDGSRRRRDD